MPRMLPISLIILGGILLIAGIALLIRNPKIQTESLTQAIALVKADGVLTPKEEKLIREIAEKEGKDGDFEIAKIQQELFDSDEDSETELIDVNVKAGLEFEKFIIQKFDKKFI